MKSIQIVLSETESPRFRIKNYSFIEQDSEKAQPIPIFRMIVKKAFTDPLDVHYWVEELFDNAIFLSEVPEELTTYIKSYEENLRFSDLYLFHDIRTKYIDFILLNPNEELSNSIVFIGYTVLPDEICFAIKAFSLNDLVQITETITQACHQKQLAVETPRNLRWLQLEQYMLPNRNPPKNDVFESFLERTLDEKYCRLFLSAFKIIDSNGYLEQVFYNQDVSISGHATKVKDLKQFTRYFSRFWKTDISDLTSDRTKTILCLHDELPNEESRDKIVYTVKPFLKQYYQLKWFEDFCSHLIFSMHIPEFNIIDSALGRHFNFLQSEMDIDIREIDFIFGIEHNGIYKIVAVECKKTLSKQQISSTNRTIREKILKSHINIIDAYLHIGCFNNGVVFDENIAEKKAMYKHGILQLPEDPKALDAPFFAFTMDSIDDFKIKFSHIIKTIFDQW